MFDVLQRVVQQLPRPGAEQPVLPTIFLNATKNNMRPLQSDILLSEAKIRPGDSLHVLFSGAAARLQAQARAYNKYLDAILESRGDGSHLGEVGENLWTMMHAEMDIARLICEQIGPTLAKHYHAPSCRNLVKMLVFGRNSPMGWMPVLVPIKLDPMLVRTLLNAGGKALSRRLFEEDVRYQNLLVKNWIHGQNLLSNEDRRRPAREIEVDRSNLFQSAYEQFMLNNAWTLEAEGDAPRLSGGLSARFRGEDGYGPGVTREFLLKALVETFDPQRGLFVACPEHPDLFYPAPKHKWKASDETGMKTRMAGRLLGLCLQAKVSPPLSLAPHVWAYVTKYPTADWDGYSQHLAIAKPKILASLRQVLRMSVEDLAATDLRFVVEETEMVPFLSDGAIVATEAKPVERELLPNGAETVVDPANRKTFVQEMAIWHLQSSVREQLDALRTGFQDVLRSFEIRPDKDLVTPELLGRYVRGRAKISVADWMRHATLKGFGRGCRTIRYFFRFLDSLGQDDLVRVLTFCTSLKRLPPNGFAGLPRKFIIQRGDPDRLPSAHTCFYTLVLPPTVSYQQFVDKCQVMLQDHSFGFQ